MKWDVNGIAICEYSHEMMNLCLILGSGSFYRAAVPQDIVNGQPDPTNWGTPVAALAPDACDPISNFVNHSIVFGKSLRL